MSLVVNGEVPTFNLNAIKPGDCIYAKHNTWETGNTGFVSSVTGECVVGNFYPGIGQIVNHFIIPVSEAAAGEWEIRWSNDLVDIFNYPEVTDEP